MTILISLTAQELTDIARGKTVSREEYNGHGFKERIHIGNENSIVADNSYNNPDWNNTEDHR